MCEITSGFTSWRGPKAVAPNGACTLAPPRGMRTPDVLATFLSLGRGPDFTGFSSSPADSNVHPKANRQNMGLRVPHQKERCQALTGAAELNGLLCGDQWYEGRVG